MSTKEYSKHKRIEYGDLPDGLFQGSPKTTLSNLEYLLDANGFGCRYNVIKKGLELTLDGRPASINEVLSLAQFHGMKTGLIPAFVEEIGLRREYNPVKDWIRSKPWDEVRRLPDLYDTIIVQDGYPNWLKEQLIYRWLLSAVAAALTESGGRFSARGVLTLQGAQGIGKTTWIAALLPAGQMRNDFIKRDHHMDGGNKDSILAAISHWIVEIGELDSSFKKDVARLKGFLTNDCDKLRRPYARGESEYPRRTVFAATLNDDRFLVDNTGNSRWWTIPVKALKYWHEIDMQQVFAELAMDFDSHAQWWLNKDEEAELAKVNLQHRTVSAIAEQIAEYVDLDLLAQPNGKFMTAIEVLKDIGVQHPTNPQCKEAASALRDLLGEPKRVQGRSVWRIPQAKGIQVAPGMKPRAPLHSEASAEPKPEDDGF